MKKIKLDRYEREIEANLDKWPHHALSAKERAELVAAASRPPRITGKREKRFNVRLTEDDLSKLQARAEEVGIPYQTLASAVLHQVAIGKLDLRLIPV